MASTSDTSTRRIKGTPRVIVTRVLSPDVEARMDELFDCRFNRDDTPLSREQLIEAMTEADVLVPTVTTLALTIFQQFDFLSDTEGIEGGLGEVEGRYEDFSRLVVSQGQFEKER